MAAHSRTREGVSITDARKAFSELANRIAYGKERVSITRNGKPHVAIISHEDLEVLEAMEDAVDGRIIEKAKEEGGAMDFDEFVDSLKD